MTQKRSWNDGGAFPSGAVATDADTLVAELQRREQQLRESQRIAHIGSWEWDLSTDRIEWSEELFRIWGLDPGEPFSYAAYIERLRPEDRDRMQSIIRQAIDARNSYVVEHRIVLPDGTTRWIQGRGYVVCDERGAPVRVRGTAQDVTDRHESEQRSLALLREQYERERAEKEREELRQLAATLEQQSRLASLGADVGTALTAPDDLRTMLQRCAQAVVDRIDAAFARVWTLNAGEQVLELQASAGMYTHLDGPHARVPIGQSTIGALAEARVPHLTNEVADDPRVSDHEWAHHEGIVSFAGYPLIVHGELVGALAMFARRALTEPEFDALSTVAHVVSLGIARERSIAALRESEVQHRQRAEQLTALATALERSNRELDAFAYAASHDLRAPLRGIANLAQWIEEDLQAALSDDTREMLGLMRSRMHRMEALIEGILQYSRAGRAHEPPVTVDVGRLVREVIDLLSPETAVMSVQSDMPVIVTERTPLQQVFQNLIANALKHGGDGVQIDIEATDAGTFWEFSVTDDGPGVPPEYHERIWGIFQTLEPRDKVEATGIGLSLVKKLVEAQGGRVGVTSTPGSGARFWFWWRKTAALEG